MILHRLIAFLSCFSLAWLTLNSQLSSQAGERLGSFAQLRFAETGESREDEEENGQRTPPCDPGGCPRPVINRNIPHLITPRNSFVAGDRLVIRWYQPDGIDRYTVTLRRRRDGAVWTETVSGSSLVYEGDFLEPETWVVVTVNAHNGEQQGSSQFLVLSQEEQQQLYQQRSQHISPDVTSLEEVLIEVELYEQFQALANSIDRLYQAIATSPEHPALYCRLASFYETHYSELAPLNVAEHLQEEAEQRGVTCDSR
jgi:hypothetical protein